MAIYRLYLLNSDNGIRGVELLDCADDDAARAEALARNVPSELWDGSRKLESFQPAETDAA